MYNIKINIAADNAVGDPLYMEDWGLKIEFEGLTLPTAYEVHFSNNPTSPAKMAIGDSSGVVVPYEYTAKSGTLYGWLVFENTTSGYTKRAFTIPITRRSPLDPPEVLPEQVTVIDTAIAALNTAIAMTNASAEAAAASAEEAETSATNAANSAAEAASSVEQVAEKVDEAQEAADASATSATAASQSAANALTSATQAAESAAAAASSATVASQSAATAQAAATRSENAMNAARTSATEADESATLAQTAVEESATNAQNAADSAEQAAASKAQAATDAARAQTYATRAQASANTASDKATSASNSAGAALNHANSAAASATAAGAAQTAAETAATTATEKAAEAEQSATDAAASAAEAQEAAAEIEADKPVIVALSVAGAGIRTAVTQSQETGEPVTVAAQYVTADPADADAIYDALHAGKRVRFDLTSDTGGGYAVRTSATRCRNAPDGRNIMHYIVGFDRGDLCNSFTGLAALRVTYIRDTSAGNSVAVTVEAVQEDFDLIFTAPLSEPIVTQTPIPATVNHTAEEVAAAYAAGKKVNAKIHFTTGTPVSFDLEPVYMATVQAGRVYGGLLVTGTDRIDAYSVAVVWDNDDPVIMIPGKVADYSEAVAGLETDVAGLDGRVDALEEAEEARVEISVSRADVASALTAAKSNTGTNNSSNIPSSGITVSFDDLRNAKSALVAGKKVRFDLKILQGANVSAVISTYTAVLAGTNMTLYFDGEGIQAFSGLQTIVFNYASSGSSEYVSCVLFANPRSVFYINFTCTASAFEQAYSAENTVMINCNRTFSAINTTVQNENIATNTIAAKLFVTESNKVVRVYELPVYERNGYEVNFRSAVEVVFDAEENGTFSIPRIFACRIAVSQEGTQLVVATGILDA